MFFLKKPSLVKLVTCEKQNSEKFHNEILRECSLP